MPRVAVHTHVHRRNGNGLVVESVALAPGDEVPGWAHVDPSLLEGDANAEPDAEPVQDADGEVEPDAEPVKGKGKARK